MTQPLGCGAPILAAGILYLILGVSVVKLALADPAPKLGQAFRSHQPWVRGETLCEQVQSHYQQSHYWYRDCGPEPGKNWDDELKKDCLQTRQQIAARPGASWNSESGWASEEQC